MGLFPLPDTLSTRVTQSREGLSLLHPVPGWEPRPKCLKELTKLQVRPQALHEHSLGASLGLQGRLTWCWSVCPSSGCRCHTHTKGEGRAFHRRRQGLRLHGESQSLNKSTTDRCNETQQESHLEQRALPVPQARAEMLSQKLPRSHFCDLTECKCCRALLFLTQLLLLVGLL